VDCDRALDAYARVLVSYDELATQRVDGCAGEVPVRPTVIDKFGKNTAEDGDEHLFADRFRSERPFPISTSRIVAVRHLPLAPMSQEEPRKSASLLALHFSTITNQNCARDIDPGPTYLGGQAGARWLCRKAHRQAVELPGVS
jgi:hypothetical protein